MPTSYYAPVLATTTVFDDEYSALSGANLANATNQSKIMYLNASGNLEWLSFDSTSISNLESYATVPSFPVTGESQVLYFAQDTAKWYRWSGSAYVDIHANLLYLAGGTMSGVLNMGGWDIEDVANMRASGVYDTTGGNMCLQWQPVGNYLKLNDDTRIVNLQATNIKHQTASVNQLTFSASPDTITAGCPLAMGGFDISNAGIITGTRLRGPLYYNTTKYLEYTGTYIDTFNIPISTGVSAGSYVQTYQLRSNNWANAGGTSLINSNGVSLIHYLPIDMDNRNITGANITTSTYVRTDNWQNSSGTTNLLQYNGTVMVASKGLYMNSLDIDSVNTIVSQNVWADSYYNKAGTIRSFYVDAGSAVFTPTVGINFNNVSCTNALVLSANSIANQTNTMTMLNFSSNNVHCSAPLVITRGSTAERPASPVNGMHYYDTTINKPIWYHGAWVDATGTVV